MTQIRGECGQKFDSEDELLAHIPDCNECDSVTTGNWQDEHEQNESETATDEQDKTNPVVHEDVRPATDDEEDDRSQAGAGADGTGAKTQGGVRSGLGDVDESELPYADAEQSPNQTSAPADDGGSGTNNDESVQHISGFLDGDDAIHSKWFFFGVGGCGGNLIDAIILRTQTLDERETELRDAWKDSIRGLASVNSNTTDELYQTCYIQEYRDEDPATLINRNSVGPPEEPGGGAVAVAGEKLAEWVFAQEENQDFAGDEWGPATDHRRVSDAQGVIFLHSSVKGTGSGATPVIASKLNDAVSTDYDMLQTDLMDPTVTMYSISVLPRSGSDDLEKSNGLVGFAKLVSSMNAVIPMDNENLESAQKAHPSIAIEIDGTEGYQLHNHRKANETLVSFLETFTFASVTGGQDATIRGDGLDPADPIRPARQCYTGDETENGEPAVVMAPSYGDYELRGGEFDKSVLDNLITNTLTDGKLVDFDYQTSWGGTFVVEGPTGQDAQIKEVCEEHFDEVIKRPDYLNIGEDDGTGSETLFPTRQQYLFRTDLDTVRLWALIYNPKMERLKRWYDWAESRYKGPEVWQEQLEHRWSHIEDVFSLLGRENRGSI